MANSPPPKIVAPYSNMEPTPYAAQPPHYLKWSCAMQQLATNSSKLVSITSTALTIHIQRLAAVACITLHVLIYPL